MDETTVVLRGINETTSAVVRLAHNAKRAVNNIGDSRLPSVVIGVEQFNKALHECKKRGVVMRYITEVTRENIAYCKILGKIAELRHLDGLVGNFAVSDSEYLASSIIYEAAPVSQAIYSNAKEIVRQHQFFFQTLWNKAIPYESKVMEIECGVVPSFTKVINDHDEMMAMLKESIEQSGELAVCSRMAGLRFTHDNFFESYKKILAKHGNGRHKGIRWVTTVASKKDARLVKKFIDAGVQVKHVKYTPPMNFAVTDKLFDAGIEGVDGSVMTNSFLVSNEKFYIDYYNSIFEEFWKSGIDAADRIKDIDQGADYADIEVMRDPHKSLDRAWGLVTSSKEEVLIMFASANAFRRQVQAGGIQPIQNAISNGAKVRILVPACEQADQMIERVRTALCGAIDIRVVDESLQTQITILMCDSKTCMIFELRDDAEMDSSDAIGMTTYSDSRSTVLSYAAIFESLWKQAELYEQVKMHDRMQKEFINIAAHELRTPIQPILGYAEILEEEFGNKNEDARAIARNARRLERLTQDILEVSRIESNSLRLNKEPIDIRDFVSGVISDFRSQSAGGNGGAKLVYLPYAGNKNGRNNRSRKIRIDADRNRLYQVLSNLIGNAFKFTERGSITVKIENGANQVIVKVTDTGTGIDPEITSRLFTKFATKSDKGTGLGLFISKSIIEAHGGHIWVENNSERGATFAFSLPHPSHENKDN